MNKLQNLLLLLTDDVVNVDKMVNSHLVYIDSIDALVDIDILKDYKSKLIADTIELNDQSQKETLEYSQIKSGLHNLMCFYSEYVDRSINLIRSFSNIEDEEFISKINMTAINSMLFIVLQDVRKQEQFKKVKTSNTIEKMDNENGYDIDGVVLV